MVGMEVGDEDLLQVRQADRRAQQLALRALGAVEQQPVAARRTSRAAGARCAVGIEPAVPRKTTSRSTARF